jgi:hypothetical protein
VIATIERGPEARAPSGSSARTRRRERTAAIEHRAPFLSPRPGNGRRDATGERARLEAVRRDLQERLHGRSDDFEATIRLRAVEDAIAALPARDGTWRWQPS